MPARSPSLRPFLAALVAVAASAQALLFAQPASAWRAGDRAEVRSGGAWYATSVVEVGEGPDAGRVKVAWGVYPDGSPNLQWVSAGTLRRPSQADAAPSGPAGTAAAPAAAQTAAGGCDYSTPAYDQSESFSAGLARRVLLRSTARLASGAGSAPLRAGLAFERLSTQAPVVNVVSVVPGQGATRVTNAAPPNATLYPIRVRYVECKQYRGSTVRYRYDGEMFCFKDRSGDWACGSGRRTIWPERLPDGPGAPY